MKVPLIAYTALTKRGEKRSGQRAGASQSEVICQLQEEDLIPLTVDECVDLGSSVPTKRTLPWSFDRKNKKINHAQLLKFSRSIATLLQAGFDLDKALASLVKMERNAAVREMASAVQAEVRGGKSFADALGKKPEVFDSVYVSLVRAAEVGGMLGEGMERLVKHIDQRMQARKTLTSALTYPAILVVVALISLTFMLGFVVPQFRPMFEEMGPSLPSATRFVLLLADVVTQYGYFIVLAGLGVFFGGRHWLSAPAVRLNIDKRVLRLPLVGALFQDAEVIRFSRSLGSLLRSGVGLVHAIELSNTTISNTYIHLCVNSALSDLREGGRLAESLSQTNVFPDLALQMVGVGEETGNLADMLLQVADVFEEELQQNTKQLLALVEPIMIMVLGVAIGGIVIAILAGIISVNELPL